MDPQVPAAPEGPEPRIPRRYRVEGAGFAVAVEVEHTRHAPRSATRRRRELYSSYGVPPRLSARWIRTNAIVTSGWVGGLCLRVVAGSTRRATEHRDDGRTSLGLIGGTPNGSPPWHVEAIETRHSRLCRNRRPRGDRIRDPLGFVADSGNGSFLSHRRQCEQYRGNEQSSQPARFDPAHRKGSNFPNVRSSLRPSRGVKGLSEGGSARRVHRQREAARYERDGADHRRVDLRERSAAFAR